MKEIKCTNCGASQFYYNNGAQVCSYCRSKFENDNFFNKGVGAISSYGAVSGSYLDINISGISAPSWPLICSGRLHKT